MKLAELVKQAEGRAVRDENGHREALRLLPSISEHQMQELERSLPRPLPAELRELLEVTQGFENGTFGIDFSGNRNRSAFEFQSVLPYGVPITADGCGNFWVIDVTKRSTDWGPIFFVCHDPPVVVFQSAEIREYVEEWLKLGGQEESKLGRTFDRAVMKVWKENPGLISHELAIQSADQELKAFAEKTGDSFRFIDLRKATVGDGFSWGRVKDPDADLKRDGDNLLFAIRKPLPKKPLLQRLFGR